MLRHAEIKDLEFIYDLIMDGSKHGYFNKLYYKSNEASNGLKIELISILSKRVRINGLMSYGVIYEKNSKPIGFTIMSTVENNKGNEIYMSSIDNNYRKEGYGKNMIQGILEQFKGKNLTLLARCSNESEIMFQLLSKNGFKHMATGEEGYRVLSYEL